MNKDSLGDRMKSYEAWGASMSLFQKSLPVIVRVDGKAFHTWTKGLEKPFSKDLTDCFQESARQVMQSYLTEAVIAYGQSDEITFVLRPSDPMSDRNGQFGHKHQKIESIAASAITAIFNEQKRNYKSLCDKPIAIFDARAFPVPSLVEAHNCVLWRQQDAVRNSINSTARSQFSHSVMQGKTCDELQDMLFKHSGFNWNDSPTHLKRGWAIRRIKKLIDPATIEDIPEKFRPKEPFWRSSLELDLEMPILNKDSEYIISLLK